MALSVHKRSQPLLADGPVPEEFTCTLDKYGGIVFTARLTDSEEYEYDMEVSYDEDHFRVASA
jgi:hypothetical protein